MKFEEVLPSYRDGSEIEYYNTYFDKWILMPTVGSCDEKWPIASLMYDEFRIIKEKLESKECEKSIL